MRGQHGGGDRDYAGWRGTVASTLIEPGVRFEFAPGPPDKTEYARVEGYPG